MRPARWPRLLRRTMLVGLSIGGLGTGCVGASGDIPDLSDPAVLTEHAARWIDDLRSRHLAASRPLTDQERRVVADHFTPELLDAARLVVLETFENPDFYRYYRQAGEPIPIDFRGMSGMAAGDLVLIHRSRLGSDDRVPTGLLFHELVHVAQSRELGHDGYVATYVEGWLETGAYRTIPHEEQAYGLTDRFADGVAFSVEDEVRRYFGP